MVNSNGEEIIYSNILSRNLERTLDPLHVVFTNEYYILDNLTIKLVQLDSKGLYKNLLAKNIKFSDDRKEILITIKDAKFSDGTPLRIEDVYYTFKRLILYGSPHTSPKDYIKGAEKLKSLDQDIEGISLVNKNTLKLILKNELKEILYYFQMSDFGILHESQYRKEKLYPIDWTKVTSGPYHLKIEKDNDQYLIANQQALNFHPKMLAKISLSKIQDKDKTIEKIKKYQIDLGMIDFLEYLENEKELIANQKVKFYGGPFDLVVGLNLNIHHSIFKKEETRKWFMKKIILGFNTDQKFETFLRKAFQVFVPGSKGFISPNKIKEIVNSWTHIDTNKIPQELANGIVISTYENGANFFPIDFKKRLEDALGIKVKIENNVNPNTYEKFYEKREHQIFTSIKMMDYKIIGEALNLEYNTKVPTLLDPNGKIKELLIQYMKTDNPNSEKEYLEKIILQMTEDSEFVPLFYETSPMFFNSEKIDTSEIHLLESYQLWKLRRR